MRPDTWQFRLRLSTSITNQWSKFALDHQRWFKTTMVPSPGDEFARVMYF